MEDVIEMYRHYGGLKNLPAFGQSKISPPCTTCLPSPKDKKKVVEDVAKEFESFFIKEFLKSAIPVSGELQEKYGYFYRDIIIDTLSQNSSFGIADFLKKSIENNLEAAQRGFISSKHINGKARSYGKF